VAKIFENYFEITYNKKIDAWDFQWVYLCFLKKGLCLTPFKNLVSNLGFHGTRSSKNSPFVNMPRSTIDLQKLSHPLIVGHSVEIDKWLFCNIFIDLVNLLS